MKKTVLSVIIPYYKGEQYIENTVNSILNSTLKDLEILLIDDGSPASSGAVCDYLSRKYNNIKVIHKENGGIAEARNRGIIEARGKYIAFVDQDDSVSSDMYLSLINIMDKYECDLVSSNYLIEYEKSGEQKAINIIKENMLLQMREIRELRKWLVMGEVMPQPKISVASNIWNCIISMDLVKTNNIGFESYIRYDDDWVFLLRCLSFSKRIYLCKEAYYRWLIHDSSESHTAKHLKNIADKYNNLKTFKLDYIKKWCDVTTDEMDSFLAYFDANAIYVITNNEAIANNGLLVKCRNVRNMTNAYYPKNINNSSRNTERKAIEALIRKKGKKAGLVYFLAVNHLYLLAIGVCKM